jgi:diguanylate cyclase (GGDEF)-like protein
MAFPKPFSWSQYSVSQKISLGYLLVSLFSLAAVIFALGALNKQTDISRHLVRVDFRSLILSQNLSRNLLAQERLEKQAVVLKDPALVELYAQRREEFTDFWKSLTSLPLGKQIITVQNPARRFQDISGEMQTLLQKQQWEEAEKFSREMLSPLRNSTLEQFRTLQSSLEKTLDATLQKLPKQSIHAYQTTLVLFFLGLLLASLVAGGLLYKFNRALQLLTSATHQITQGNYDMPPALDSHDEFGKLAQEFSKMALKLKEMEQRSLDASPLTHLPGNLTVEKELQRRIDLNLPFANVYIDLDNFKAYNDRYGYQAGNTVIGTLGDLIQEITAEMGNNDDMVGHIGGDDYVILSTPECADKIAAKTITEFDAVVPGFYSEKDRQKGSFTTSDRFGIARQFPLLTVSIACVSSGNLKNPSPLAIGRECAKMKKHLKKLPGSNYMVDRREER